MVNAPGQGWYDTMVEFVQSPPDVGFGMYVAQLAGIGLATAWNFCANLFWTWQATEGEAGDAETSK